jgi:hypothetical protein
MERKVGEIFEYNGEWYQCVEQPKQYGCATVFELCAFSAVGNCELDKCSGTYRSDSKSVIFKKLEKVGEPYKGEGKIFQPYQAYIIPVPKWDYEFFMLLHQETKIIDIEIKQNKENMEEKKLSLKPFDLEAAKAGKPVCTRDGRKARIICFDAKRKDGKNIIALIPSKEYSGFEDLVAYPNNGNYHGGHENDGDLMMLPQKKEGWVRIYKSASNVYYLSSNIYKTEEEAKHSSDCCYVGASKISWEE